MIDGDAHDAVEPFLSPRTLLPRGETVRGRHASGHLMNAVPGLRFPVQGDRSVVVVGPKRARRRLGT